MDILTITDYIGIASAALSGFLFGVRKSCDWLGLFIAAFLTALGGGIIRDVLVGREIYSFSNYLPVIIVIFMMILAVVLNLHKKQDIEDKFFFIFTDAIGIVSFSLVGTMVTINHDYNVFGVVLIAFANGIGGGILRDVLLNEVPWLLRTGLYGTISMGVGLAYFCLYKLGFANVFSVIALLILGVTIRVFAYYRSWNLPKVGYEK